MGALALLLCLIAASCVAGIEGLLVVNTTTVEGVSSPLAIDIEWAPMPSFAWRVYGGAQGAYRVIVSADAAMSSPLWDSGTVASPVMSAAYAGSPLPHGATLYLSITVAPSASGPFSAADMSQFGTGLDSVAWAADAAAHGGWLAGCTTGAASPALRLSFTLSPAPIVRARAYASAQGLYALYVNGERAGAGRDAVLTPGWATVPTSRVVADAYDATATLRAGENVLGMTLGQGKWGYNREFCDAADATCYAGVVRLVIEQSGGNVTVVDSSAQWAWSCAPSAITYNSLFGGETFDARIEQPGWASPGFVPPPGAAPWTPAPRRSTSTVAVISAAPPAMRVIEDVVPVAVSQAQGVPQPVGGVFVRSNTTGSPDIWWIAGGTATNPAAATLRFFVTVCQPCASVDACSTFVGVPGGVIDAIPKSPSNFSCDILPRGGGAWQFDLGSNMAGFCLLALPPAFPPGTALTLVHGEILDDAGVVDNTFGSSDGTRRCPVPGINCADQTDSFVYGTAAPPPSWAPSFTFHGMRHVALFGWPAAAPPPTIATLTCSIVHSAMAVAGGIEFNNTVLNKLQAAVVRTQRSNLFSVPSDCPTREKRGWGGDMQVTTDSALCNLAAQPLYAHLTRTFAESAEMSCSGGQGRERREVGALGGGVLPTPVRPSDYVCCPPGRFGCNGNTPKNATGFLPDVAPFDSISGWPGDWVWQVMGVVIPHALLTTTGDANAVSRVWPMIWNLVAAADNSRDANGLLIMGAYGDWLALEPVSMSLSENFYLVRAAVLAAEIAGALGQPADAAALTALAADVSAALVRASFDRKRGAWDPPTKSGGSNANAQAMALAVALGGAATANASASIAAALAADIAANGGHPNGGVASTRWTFAGLDAAGRADLALELALVPTSPSWAYMVETNDMPGTVWEAWTGDATHSDGSKNHPMLSGGIGVWLHEGAAGLRLRYAIDHDGAAQGVDDAATTAAATAALATSPLGWDPRARAGLSSAETLAALAVASADAADAALPRAGLLGRARAALVARGVPSRSPSHPHLRATLTAAPRAAFVRAVGAASAWRECPAGRSELHWAATGGGANASGGLSLALTLPAGVRGRVALPLDILRDAAGAAGVAAVRVTPPQALRGAARSSAHDAALLIGDAPAPRGLACGPATSVEGVRVRVCGAGAAVASAADADGEARLHGGKPLWDTGALLWQIEGEGRWEFRV